MWNELVKSLAEYSSAVVTGLDREGYPFSVRCRPLVDIDAQVLRVQFTPETTVQPGPAGLLCHSHDEWLWKLKSFIVFGTVEKDATGWIFRPERFVAGSGSTSPLAAMAQMIKAQRSARQYIKKRGLPWPSVPWKEFKALRAESKKKNSET